MRRIWLRRTLQALSMALVLLAPLVGLWGISVENLYSPSELARRYSEAASIVAPSMHDTLGSPSESWVGVLVGAPWSVALGGLELTDPLAVATLLPAGVVPPVAFLLGAVLVLAMQALVGRFFCGWLCPYGIVSRFLLRLRRPLEAVGLAVDVQPPWWLRWALLVAMPVAAAAGVAIAPAVLPYLTLSRALHGWLFGSGMGAAGMLGALLLSDLILWDHGVCRSVCPAGAWMRLTGRVRVLRLVAYKGSACTKGCHECANSCWLGLDPRAGRVPDDCDSCGRCVPVCPSTRLDVVLRVARTTGPILALLALGLAGCGAPTPEVVSATASWSSPFDQPDSARIPIAADEWSVDGAAVSLAVAVQGDGSRSMRLYIEEVPGEPWRGPLHVNVRDRGGSVPLAFEGPTSPRSVPRPSMYEATVAATPPVEIEILDGPVAGRTYRLPDPTPPLRLGGLAPIGVVLVMWVFAQAWVRVRAGSPQSHPG